MNEREEQGPGTCERVRDFLMYGAGTLPELAEMFGVTRSSIAAYLAILRKDGYSVNVIGNLPSPNGKGTGHAIYSIDSRPPGPKVGKFSLSALWGASKEVA